MTKLEELIRELCPNGVDHKSLGTLGNFYGGLTGKTKEDFVDGNEKFITYKNVYSNPALQIDVEDKVKISDGEKQNLLQYGDVIFTGSSETLEECGFSSVITVKTDEKLYLNSFCFFLRFNDSNIILPDFSKHLFRSDALRQQIKKAASGTTRYNVSKEKIKKVVIPIPPLEIQHEIIRILDTFTELTSELTENLSKEFTARKHQYTYYRNKLLEKNTKAMKMKLGDIFDFQNGFAFKSRLFKESGNAILRIVNIKANQISTDNLVFFDEADYKENLSPYIVRQNDIVIAMSGATTGKIGVNVTPFNFYLNQRVGKFIPKENIVLSRYLYHLLLQMSEEIYAISEGGAQPNLSSEKLKKLTAYIPPISEQKRIVKVLDTFAYLCTDLTSGLPAEIEARKKQYEYYRDNLLSFTPAD